MTPDNKKSPIDGEPCTLRDLFTELENSGLVDITLNSHVCERPEAAIDRLAESLAYD
jgi:hypothetical protein